MTELDPKPNSKAVKERIRENQRRSRARKQEYIADLERRLSESHKTSQQADLNQEAVSQLQAENTQLRGLLATMGVKTDFVDDYLVRERPRLPSDQISADKQMRPIKPKVLRPIPPLPHDTSDLFNRMHCSDATRGEPTTGAILPVDAPGTRGLLPYSQAIDRVPESPKLEAFSPVGAQPQTSTQATNSPDSWFTSQATLSTPNIGQHSHPPSSFYCEAFDMTVASDGKVMPQDTIWCIEAKSAINAYQHGYQEMMNIKGQLYHHMYKHPHGSCVIDRHAFSEMIAHLSLRSV